VTARLVPKGKLRDGVLFLACALLAAEVGLAQTEAPIAEEIPPPFGQRSLFILHLPLLDFGPAIPQAPAVGRVDWQIASAYANTFSTTQAVNFFHNLSPRRGQALDDAEVAALHRDFPDRPLLFVDGEVVRTALLVRYGLTPRLFVAIEVPYLDRSATADGAVRSFHSSIGQDQNGRDLFPSGGYAVLIQPAGGSPTFFSGPRKSGIGDVSVSLGWRRPISRSGVAYGADVTLKAPSGAFSDLNGSGGWDAGFLLFVVWRKGLWTLEGDGSFVQPGTWRAPVRVEPDRFTRALVSIIRDFGARTRVGASMTLEQSPFHERRFSTLSRAGVEAALGIEYKALPGLPVRLTLTEHLPTFGDRADFAIGLALRYR
jgi:hypothetical protein